MAYFLILFTLICIIPISKQKGLFMFCPKCAGKTKVVGTVTGLNNKRFRECVSNECRYSFSTIEAIQFDDYWREYAKDTFKSDNKIELSS